MTENLGFTDFKVCIEELPPAGVWRFQDLNEFLPLFRDALTTDIGCHAELQDIMKTEYLRGRKVENYLYLYLRTDFKTSTQAVQGSAETALEKSGFAQMIEVVEVSVRKSGRGKI